MDTTSKSELRGVGALLLLTASFAMLTVFARYLNSGFTIAQQVYLRSAVALLIAVVAFGRWIRWRTVLRVRGREWAVIGGRAVLLYVIGTVLFTKGATLSTVVDVSFIAALPLVPALGLLLRRAPVTIPKLLYIAGATAGVAILSGFGTDLRGSWNYGNLLALTAVTAIAVSYIGRDWHDDTLNNREITVLTIAFGAIGVALISLARGEGIPHTPPGTSPTTLWTAIAAAGALNASNVFLSNYAFQHVNPTRGGNYLTVECVWGLLFGWTFYHQIPTYTAITAGTLIVLCAIGLNTTGTTRRPERSRGDARCRSGAKPSWPGERQREEGM